MCKERFLARRCARNYLNESLEGNKRFKNKGEIVNEEGSNIGTDNHGSLSEQEKIIHFPS